MPWVLPPPFDSNGGRTKGYMVVSLNYCSQNGGNLYRAPYYNGNPYIGPRTIENLDQSPYISLLKNSQPLMGGGGVRGTQSIPD